MILVVCLLPNGANDRVAVVKLILFLSPCFVNGLTVSGERLY